MSMRHFAEELRWITLLIVIGLMMYPAAGAGESTRLLRTPTVSATQIAFAYANNIWVVERAGGSARRPTSFQGQTANPHFSPDGHWIAFSAEYAGNTDAYVVPSEGGEPKRLTWHPGADQVQGWTNDGKSVISFLPPRHLGPQRRTPFLDGAGRGRGRRAAAAAARVSGQDIPGWHAHRLPHEQLLGRRAPQLPRRAEPPDLDRRPQELSAAVAGLDRFQGYGSRVGRRRCSDFISDRDGVANIWVYETKTKKLTQSDPIHRFRRQGSGFRARGGGLRTGRPDS